MSRLALLKFKLPLVVPIETPVAPFTVVAPANEPPIIFLGEVNKTPVAPLTNNLFAVELNKILPPDADNETAPLVVEIDTPPPTAALTTVPNFDERDN